MTYTKETRENWKLSRKKGIGGSDAAAIMGISPWKGVYDVWLDKTGRGTETEMNEQMHWGILLEDLVAKEFMRKTGEKVKRVNGILISTENPFMIASIDRMVIGGRAGLECKTASAYSADKWDFDIPVHYMPQVQHYMAVTGFDKWYVAVLIGGQEFKYYTIPRNDNYIRELIKNEKEFWELVKNETPPSIDGSKATSETIKKMYPEATAKKTVELPQEATDIIYQYQYFSEVEKEAGVKKREAENQLKDMLKDAEKGVVNEHVVKWQNVTSKKVDTEILKVEYPDIYDRCSTISSYRRFMIK